MRLKSVEFERRLNDKLGLTVLKGIHCDVNNKGSEYNKKVDVDEQNDCLRVLKGNHKWLQNIRSFPTLTPFFNFNQVEKGLVVFLAKAWDAVIFRHNVILGLKPNLTSNIRVVAIVSVAPKLASYVNYIKDGEEFHVLKVDNDSYITELSKLYSSENINVEEVDRLPIEPEMVLDFSDFDKKYKKEFPDSFFSRVGKLFKNDK